MISESAPSTPVTGDTPIAIDSFTGTTQPFIREASDPRLPLTESSRHQGVSVYRETEEHNRYVHQPVSQSPPTYNGDGSSTHRDAANQANSQIPAPVNNTHGGCCQVTIKDNTIVNSTINIFPHPSAYPQSDNRENASSTPKQTTVIQQPRASERDNNVETSDSDTGPTSLIAIPESTDDKFVTAGIQESQSVGSPTNTPHRDVKERETEPANRPVAVICK